MLALCFRNKSKKRKYLILNWIYYLIPKYIRKIISIHVFFIQRQKAKKNLETRKLSWEYVLILGLIICFYYFYSPRSALPLSNTKKWQTSVVRILHSKLNTAKFILHSCVESIYREKEHEGWSSEKLWSKNLKSFLWIKWKKLERRDPSYFYYNTAIYHRH